MGKPTGFMEYEREVSKAQGPLERIRHFNEFHEHLPREKQQLHFAELNNMYMTGKDNDAVIKRVSFTVSEGINIAIGETFMER